MERFEMDLKGFNGSYWQENAERKISRFRGYVEDGKICIDNNGAAFWRNSGNFLPSDAAEILWYTGFPFNLEATQSAWKAQMKDPLKRYMEARQEILQEELCKMRGDYGSGEMVVNMITGERIRFSNTVVAQLEEENKMRFDVSKFGNKNQIQELMSRCISTGLINLDHEGVATWAETGTALADVFLMYLPLAGVDAAATHKAYVNQLYDLLQESAETTEDGELMIRDLDVDVTVEMGIGEAAESILKGESD